MARYAKSVSNELNLGLVLTYSSDHDDVSVLPFTHHRQDSFDDVDVGEEVDLEDFVHEADRSAALSQLLDSTNDSYMHVQWSL